MPFSCILRAGVDWAGWVMTLQGGDSSPYGRLLYMQSQ